MKLEFKIPFICFHNYQEAKDDKRVLYCPKCGKTKVLPCAHSWSEDNIAYEGGQRNEEGKIYKWTTRYINMKCLKCGERKTVEG